MLVSSTQQLFLTVSQLNPYICYLQYVVLNFDWKNDHRRDKLAIFKILWHKLLQLCIKLQSSQPGLACESKYFCSTLCHLLIYLYSPNCYINFDSTTVTVWQYVCIIHRLHMTSFPLHQLFCLLLIYIGQSAESLISKIFNPFHLQVNTLFETMFRDSQKSPTNFSVLFSHNSTYR